MKVGDKVICIREYDFRYKINKTYTVVEMRIRNNNIMKDGNIKILESAYIEGGI